MSGLVWSGLVRFPLFPLTIQLTIVVDTLSHFKRRRPAGRRSSLYVLWVRSVLVTVDTTSGLMIQMKGRDPACHASQTECDGNKKQIGIITTDYHLSTLSDLLSGKSLPGRVPTKVGIHTTQYGKQLDSFSPYPPSNIAYSKYLSFVSPYIQISTSISKRFETRDLYCIIGTSPFPLSIRLQTFMFVFLIISGYPQS